ncbi:MAG TPA: tyrosine-type recombinase/integrase [Micromonosporaceae bacterium]
MIDAQPDTAPGGAVLPVPRTAAQVATGGDGLPAVTAAWLWSYRESQHTRAAYARDVRDFLAWCAQRRLDPLVDVRRSHADAYAAHLANAAQPRTGRPLAPTSVARRLSALSSWYAYLVDSGLTGHNPMARVRRPRIDRDHTATVGLSSAEAAALLAATGDDPTLGAAGAAALLGFLVQIGARVSEVCALDVTDLGYDSGHRTVRLRMKGGKTRTRAVPPSLSDTLARYLDDRGSPLAGPLFVTVDGRRVDRHTVYRFVRRAARAAGLPNADRITPHSFRHAWATLARQAGASLEQRQYALGHADPRTTQRYDRARTSLDADPSYLVAGVVTTPPPTAGDS